MENARTQWHLLARSTLSTAVCAAPAVATAASGARHASSASKSGAVPAGKLSSPPDAKTNAKINVYIELMNCESARLFDQRASWLSQVDRKAGPRCNAQNLGLNGIDPGAEARYARYKKTILAKPKLEIDDAALKMVEALEALLEPTSNPELETEKYTQGHESIRAFVNEFTDQRDQLEIEATAKKYGKHNRYRFALIVKESKALLRSIATEAHEPDPNSAPIAEKLIHFTALTEESKRALSSAPAASKSQAYPPGLSLLLSDSLPRFQKAVARYVATLDNKAARNRVAQAKSDWQYVIDCYNKAVDQMNGVSFDK